MLNKKNRRKPQMNKSRGAVEFLILFIVIAFGLFVSGFFHKDTSPQTPVPVVGGGGFVNACCDTGNGNDCKAQTNKKVTYKGTDYGLIKSNITQTEAGAWLKDSGEKFNDQPIILNDSQNSIGECGNHHDDQVWKKGACYAIPDDELIYVCKKDCKPGTGIGEISYYGSATTVYDVYFRLSDIPNPGIPDVIKNCDPKSMMSTSSIMSIPGKSAEEINYLKSQQTVAATGVTAAAGKQKLIFPTGTSGLGDNLQLKTFKVVEEAPPITKTGWLSPYCKPAIYLYPTKEESVSVKVNPLEPLTYTDPLYPKNGWDVTASPNGAISYQNKSYNYLYYETAVPDDKIEKPKEGFVVDKNQIPTTLSNMLGLLGLNKKESEEFVSYWSKVLPNSPYYFIGVVSKSNLDAIAPLNISPKPDTTIRVTLYFEALDKKIEVTPPYLTPIERTGFTVVEWGGIFKKDKNHPFSCFM